MAIKISKIFNARILILIACIVTFVLLNSSQESYVQISDIASTTLITTDEVSVNSTSTDTQEEDPTGPTFPSYTAPDTDNGNGIINPDKPTIPSQIIPVVIASAIIILVVVLVLQKRKAGKSAGFFQPKKRVPSTSAKKTREKFRTHITTLMEMLNEYLERGNYAEGIIFGFHQLDSNMKRVLGIRRETYLTPREFSQSMDLPDVVQPLNKIIDIFYLARYRVSPMKYEDLRDFIIHLQTLKAMSEFDSDIKITRTERIGDENE